MLRARYINYKYSKRVITKLNKDSSKIKVPSESPTSDSHFSLQDIIQDYAFKRI